MKNLFKMNKVSALIMLFLVSVLFHNTIAQKKYPPSVVKYGETNYLMDSDFIKNKDWTEFLYYQKNKFGETSKEYKRNLPNLTLWNNTYKDDDIMKFSGQYADYPIVGVSFEQINDYCAWRADRIEEKYNQKYVCRLPTEEESFDFFENHKPTKPPILEYSNLFVMIKGGQPNIISFSFLSSRSSRKSEPILTAVTQEKSNPTFSTYKPDEIFYFFCVFDEVK